MMKSSVMLGTVMAAAWVASCSPTTRAEPMDRATPEEGEHRAERVQTPAEAELTALGALIEGWVDRDEGPTWNENPCPEVSSRLALFEERFGVHPSASEGWNELAATARRALQALIDRTIRPVPGVAHEDAWIGPQWSQMRALLLEVGGRAEEARALLLDPDAIEVSACCRLCLSGDLHTLGRARAELLWRAGELRAALQHQASACMAWPFLGRDWEPDVALDRACYGVLLLRTDDATIGGDAVGALVLQDVVHRWPDTSGGKVAESLLERAGVALDPRAGRLESLPLSPGTSGSAAIAGALVLGREGDPACWRLLAIRTEVPRPEWELPAWSVTTSWDGLEQQRSFLIDRATSREGEIRARALLALQGLDGTGRGMLAAHIERFATERADAWAVGEVDRLTRLLCGAGPPIAELSAVGSEEWCATWRSWLAAR